MNLLQRLQSAWRTISGSERADIDKRLAEIVRQHAIDISDARLYALMLAAEQRRYADRIRDALRAEFREALTQAKPTRKASPKAGKKPPRPPAKKAPSPARRAKRANK